MDWYKILLAALTILVVVMAFADYYTGANDKWWK